MTENIVVTDDIIDLHFAAIKNNTSLHGLIIDQISTSVKNDQIEIPVEFILVQNYPNPFNGSTTIEYQLNQNAQVVMSIFDLSGNKILNPVDNFQEAGNYKIFWKPKVSSSGLYFVQLHVSNNNVFFTDKKKMLYLK